MRRLLPLLGLALLAACETERAMPDGHRERCVGLNREERPGVRYEYSALNIILAIGFSETVVVPVVVALDEYKCPKTGAGS